jgi:arylsulfatase A-like enzyme
MRKLGVIEDRWELSPRAGNWSSVKNKDWEARRMEVYAAMIDRMDQGIGKIVDELKKQGVLENTLVMYFQDNGGCAEGSRPRGNATRADRPTLEPMDPTALQKNMVPRQTRDGYPVLEGSAGVMPGPADTFHAYGRDWANVSNTPFREYKSWVHEGGISTPLVAHWPAGIKRKGKLEHQASHLIDIMPTTLELAGVEKPDHVQFKSLMPLIRGTRDGNYRAIYGAYLAVQRMVAEGDYKLILYPRIEKVLLYNMTQDPLELKDLAADPQFKPVIKKLFARLLELQEETGDSLDLKKVYPALL